MLMYALISEKFIDHLFLLPVPLILTVQSTARRHATRPIVGNGISVDLANIPPEFPLGPPEEWKNPGAPLPGSLPIDQMNKVRI
jgi:hypothetical protein